ncbi:MAG: hypothetical protein P4L84_15915 [Isosphaeraceae bacterium]|nr:hypothetical protein [Isosphaeraceae bacterium]
MPKPESIAPIAHLHPPRYPHEAVEIIGNRKGLERLIHTLIEAVDQGYAVGTVESADGYAAHVCVTCLEGRRRPEEWRRSGSPLWDIDDPFVARIMDLTEENDQLRDVIKLIRRERKSRTSVQQTDDGVANNRAVNE